MTAIDDKIAELTEKNKKLREKYNTTNDSYYDCKDPEIKKNITIKRGRLSKLMQANRTEISNLQFRQTGTKIVYERDNSVNARSSAKANKRMIETNDRVTYENESAKAPRHDPMKDKNPPGHIDNKAMATPGGYSVPTGQSSGPTSTDDLKPDSYK